MLKKKTLRSVTLFHVKNQIDSNKTIFFFRISLLSLLHSLYYPDG